MSMTLYGKKLKGRVRIPESKSVVHRELIAQGLAIAMGNLGERETPADRLLPDCKDSCDDILATRDCMCRIADHMRSFGGKDAADAESCENANVKLLHLYCRESGTTLRLLLPVVGALGIHAHLHIKKGLAARPHDVLMGLLNENGCLCSLKKGEGDSSYIEICGKLCAGTYTVPGNISSQYISGLLFALPLCAGESYIRVKQKLESKPYVDMSITSLITHGLSTEISDGGDLSTEELISLVYRVPGDQKYLSCPMEKTGDWSAAAFFYAANYISEENCVEIEGLDPESVQGDRRIADVLDMFRRCPEGEVSVDISDIPDLAPILSVAALARNGRTVFTGAKRLHYKESDRVFTTLSMISALGGKAFELSDEVNADASRDPEPSDRYCVEGGQLPLKGGTVDACNDHRIAMSAAIASTVCTGPVAVLGEECVSKSYPAFWDDFSKLSGGNGMKPAVIDFHTHIFADELAPRAVAKLTEEAHGLFSAVHDMTASGLIARMDEWGISRSVILPVITKRSQVEKVNAWAAAQGSERIVPFGGIYPNSGDWREQIDYVCSLGLKGIKLHAEYQNFTVDDPEMLKIYDYAFDKGLIIVHHAGFDPAYSEPFKSSPKQFAAVADALKGGVMIAAHLGGSRQWEDVERYLAGKNIWLDTSMGLCYYPHDLFMRIVKKHGADRILFATDSPWSNAGEELEKLNSLPLTDLEKEMIKHLNAERLLDKSRN